VEGWTVISCPLFHIARATIKEHFVWRALCANSLDGPTVKIFAM